MSSKNINARAPKALLLNKLYGDSLGVVNVDLHVDLARSRALHHGHFNTSIIMVVLTSLLS